ncbi:restriction endonuclease fold toxin 5 domain-containing protein [Paraburkholderia sp. MMS20-SJTN17]|uniref:Restriction endonuclease fold toxin 5 domain-containing protein n=1 Tax=Paraburkholderia translucens TaxID=2886945 RepID=A0ABS8KDV2_9BURK|nr:restriction endonuclease fold toxin 5 domain-containing protein [Paraburkholderia sp. MMS20-SJTN17]MCC8402936.1 restriction endonuclease fold toxin 5 domain-containing protein [Paraburkholderia sp. MMS20-SJTN17]
MGIPFLATLEAAAHAMAQAMPIPVPVPTPAPSAGSTGGSGTGAGAEGGWGELPRDRSRERERPCKCPPEKGAKVQKNHSMNPEPRRYQAHITGFEYRIETDEKGRETRTGWNMEWFWEGIYFDGFQDKQCLLQEAKANYDQFLDKKGKPLPFFEGFDDMVEAIEEQGTVVRLNPPTRLMWYFQTPKTRELMLSVLQKFNVSSVYQP